MSKTIGFITDSGADVPKNVQEKYNIKVIPITSMLDGKTYRSGVDITNDEYYDLLTNSKEFPTTAQPTAEDFANAYTEMLEKYDSLVVTTIASAASGTYSSANMGAEELVKNGADITVVDSMQLSLGAGVPIVNAVKMHAEEGKSKDEIVDYLMTATRRDTPYFLLDDLTQLKKGGRIKGSQAAIANLLDIKPILWVNEGLTEVMGKVRGSKKSVMRLIEIMEEKGDNLKDETVHVVHARGGEKLEFLLKLIDEKISPKAVNVMEVGPTIATHSGLGVVAVYFKHKA